MAVSVTIIKTALTIPKAALIKPAETGKKILTAIMAVCMPLIIIVVLLCGITSAVSGYVTEDMLDFWQSELYLQIETANQRWVNAELTKIINRAFAENSIQSDAAVDVMSQQEKMEVLAANHISVSVTVPAVPYTLAYINHCDAIRSKWGEVFNLVMPTEEEDTEDTIEWKQIQSFYDSVTTVQKMTYIEEDIVKTTYFVQVMSLEEIAQMYWPEDTQTAQMYLESVAQYSAFLGGGISYVMHDTGLQVPHYFQTDYEHVSYGKGTIATSGCAPTCIAMCLSYLTKSPVTPGDVVAWTGNRFYNWGPGGGSYWSIFPACAAHWNCEIVQTRDINLVLQALEAGMPVIASMAPGHFTASGHFIVLCGSTSTAELYVNDPSKSNFRRYGPAVPAEWVWTEAKGFFIFSKG